MKPIVDSVLGVGGTLGSLTLSASVSDFAAAFAGIATGVYMTLQSIRFFKDRKPKCEPESLMRKQFIALQTHYGVGSSPSESKPS